MVATIIVTKAMVHADELVLYLTVPYCTVLYGSVQHHTILYDTDVSSACVVLSLLLAAADEVDIRQA